MRLLVAMPDPARREAVCMGLYARWEGWRVEACGSAADALSRLREDRYDLFLLHEQLAGGGLKVLQQLTALRLPCPPRVLYLCEPEQRSAATADCFAPPSAGVDRLCRLLEILMNKPVPALALQNRHRLVEVIDLFLDELSMPRSLKGRRYAAWILLRLTPSPLGDGQSVSRWYSLCAEAYGATSAAVERCLRVAVESVFTQGSIQGIERCFGATVDPEKGKPTNRAFLLMAARLLRERMADHSFTDTRSLNSSEMHHKPAAPTSV